MIVDSFLGEPGLCCRQRPALEQDARKSGRMCWELQRIRTPMACPPGLAEVRGQEQEQEQGSLTEACRGD